MGLGKKGGGHGAPATQAAGEGEVLHGGAERIDVRWVNGKAPLKVSLYGVAPGGAVSMHVHTGKTEHWLIVSGHGHVTIGDAHLDVAPGDVVSTPSGVPHRLVNRAADRLLFVNLVEIDGDAPVSTRELED